MLSSNIVILDRVSDWGIDSLNGEVPIVPGYQNIDGKKSYGLLRSANVEKGTFIVRPSSLKGTYTMDVKEDIIFSQRIDKNTNVYSYRKDKIQISANCMTDLILEIIKKSEGPFKLTPYKSPLNS